MKLADRFKSFVSHIAKRHGYHIERIVDYGENELCVFNILIDYLAPKDPSFFFVQVGANDGLTGDPICEFVQRYHWRGLLLEPQPEVFGELTENYKKEPQLILENAAVGEQVETLSMYTVTGSSYLGSFDRKALTRRVSDQSRIVEIPVQVTTFATLAKKHEIDHVDLLMIDTEGFDFEIIKLALNSEFPAPRLIRYEHLHLSTPDRKACTKLLVKQGYQLLRDGRDTIAFRKEIDC